MPLDVSSLGELLERRAADSPDKPYLFFEDRQWSYGQLNEEVDRLASGLARAGVGRGTHVNVHLSNRPEFVQLFFALAKLGVVMIPTNLALRENELGYILKHADAAFSVTESAFLELFAKVLPTCPNLQTLIVAGVDRPQALQGRRTLAWADVAGSGTAAPRVTLEASDPALIMYTSGTTALPKGAMISHQNVLSAGHSWMWLVGFTAKDRTMTGLPLFHANALFFSCVGSMVYGGSFVLLRSFSPSRYLQLARQYGATHFNFIGPAMAIMLQQPPAAGDTQHPVRVVHDAMGAPELIAEWSRRFEIAVVMLYNLTECTIATGSPISGPHAVKLGSIGWAAPSLPFPTEVRVLDDEGRDTAPRVIGEIVVRGPALMKGYYKDPEKTAETIRDGWLHTGDAGYREDDGCFWFSDRIKDMVKPKGENVSSAEVESTIASHPKVADVGIIGVMDPLTGEEIKASILLKPSETAETVPPEEILAWCGERLAAFKVPRFIEYRTTPLPRTLGGAKILKREIRKEKANLIEGCYDRRKGRWLE
jgi:carnitine-CoA ligase